jgi:2-polyprenyl-3-methyl-5-hydroxy-6-metoxy-1,4-benzoquinol methylase
VNGNIERASPEDFDRRHALGAAAASRRVEQIVMGSDYGATSYTTAVQADELAVHLRLGPEVDLLDVGAGSGWPGLYLAATTGCRVVLADRPAEGLRIAQRRAFHDGLADDCALVRSSGDKLPFLPETFDAVTHADVLC